MYASNNPSHPMEKRLALNVKALNGSHHGDKVAAVGFVGRHAKVEAALRNSFVQGVVRWC